MQANTARMGGPGLLALLLLVLSPVAAAAAEVLPETIEALPVTNAGFDADLSGWAGDTDAAAWSPLDADANPLSGSAVFSHADPDSGGMVLASGDCHLRTLPRDGAARVRLRYAVPEGAATLVVVVGEGFAGDTPASDGPCIGPGLWRTREAAIAAGAGFIEWDSGWMALDGAPLLELRLAVHSRDGEAFRVHLDDIRFELAERAGIFGDGLER